MLHKTHENHIINANKIHTYHEVIFQVGFEDDIFRAGLHGMMV